jgi:hypothetical protein
VTPEAATLAHHADERITAMIDAGITEARREAITA